MSRQRLTWVDRAASAPPAVPGYNVEDQDHPAHQPDPAYEAYKKGDPSAWAEDPRNPPYPQGNPPSIPGYDVEDQDHPAHKEQPRVEKMNPKGANLRRLVEKRAEKCIRLARHMLGKKANTAMVEDQALDLMDLPDSQLDASLERLSGNPMMAEDLDEEIMSQDDFLMDDGMDDLGLDMGMDEDLDLGMDDGLLDDGMDDLGMDDGLLDDGMDDMLPADDFDMEGIMAKLASLTRQVRDLKRQANQNDPSGPTLAPGFKSEEQVRAEGASTTNLQQAKTARAMFASMDTDRDGFLMAEDWTGSKAMFAAIDEDEDDIISEQEFMDSMAPTGCTACGDDLDMLGGDEDLDPEETSMLAEMEMEAAKFAAKKSEDEEIEEVEEEDEAKETEASKKATDEAAMFGLMGDPMGLTDVNASSPEDEAALASIFGKTADDDEKEEDKETEEDEPEEDESEEKEEAPKTAASRTAAAKQQRVASQRPQGRKPNPGVRTVGTLTRTASVSGSDVDELSKLWQSDPDVSEVFSR